jgi:hypothetical protein
MRYRAGGIRDETPNFIRCACPGHPASDCAVARATTFTFITIDVPDAVFTVASGINARGQIVGLYDAPGGAQGFLTGQGFLATSNSPCRRRGVLRKAREDDGDSRADCGDR